MHSKTKIDMVLDKIFIQNNTSHKCQNLILNVKMLYNTTFDWSYLSANLIYFFGFC